MPKAPLKKEAHKSPARIPGYFYDKEKKKYFAIRNTNDPSVPYSNGYIKALEAREEREKLQELIENRNIGQVKRSKILETPLAGGLLSRAYGIRGGNKIDGASILANGLDLADRYPTHPTTFSSTLESPMFKVAPRLDLGISYSNIYVVAENRFSTFTLDVETLQVPQIISVYFGQSGPSSSISYNAAYQKVCATWLSGRATSGVTILSDSVPTIGDVGMRPEEAMLDIGPGYVRGNGEVDIYCSATPPETSPYIFVVGTSHGLLAIEKTNYNISYITPNPDEPSSEYAPKDTFALEYLPDNPSILLSGGRRGYLNITDLRIPEYGCNADVVYHPSSITHIKAIDTRRIVVAGMKSNLCQYDLRYRKAYDTQHSKFLLPSRLTKTTLPLLTYPEYQNQATQFLGFDIDVEGGIIAAAQEKSNHHAVRLFDLHGGHALDSPLLTPPLPEQPVNTNVRCLRFVDDRQGGAKSVWLSQPDNFQRYFWC